MRRWDVSDKPLFWMASSALFALNGLMSFVEGHWELAALEAGTGALALVAAASSADRARHRSERLGGRLDRSTADRPPPQD